MNLSKVVLSGLLVMSSLLPAHNAGIYYSELEAFKKDPATKELFNEDAHAGLSAIQRDVIIYKNLTSFQRFVRAIFLGFDVIIVTPETLPKLYEYVDGICQKAHIATPAIFVTRQDGFFNAFAQKLFMSTGGILIGQKLMQELSDEALEGVVAHEIGHIKYNHVNKNLALVMLTFAIYYKLVQSLGLDRILVSPYDTQWDIRLKKGDAYFKQYLLGKALSLLPLLIVNKRFEKEADEFACKDNSKSQGIIEFFKLMLKKDQLREEEFVAIYELLQKNKSDLSFSDYYFDLIIRYYGARMGHSFTKAYKYIYYNTFIGAHPTPEARIKAAQKCLCTKKHAI